MECRDEIFSEDYREVIIDYPVWESGEGEKLCSLDVGSRFHILYVKREGLPPILSNASEYQNVPKVYGLMRDELKATQQNSFAPGSLIASGITQLQGEPLNLSGRGVVIAIIDTGINYTLPQFRDEEGKSRILAIWDQTIQVREALKDEEGSRVTRDMSFSEEGLGREEQNGEGEENEERREQESLKSGVAGNEQKIQKDSDFLRYPYGTVYTREQINEALSLKNPYELVPTRDEDGHGTSLAAVAAGSSLRGGSLFLGAAPQAELVIVKLKPCKRFWREYYLLSDRAAAYLETDIMTAAAFVDSFAIQFRRPLVICIGLGSSLGDHDGNAALSLLLNEIAVKRSRAVVVCGGNEGDAAHHYSASFARQLQYPAYVEHGAYTAYGQQAQSTGDAQYGQQAQGEAREVEVRVAENHRGFVMECWGQIPDLFNISIKSPGGETILPVQIRIDQSFTYRFVYERTEVTISSILVESVSGEELIVFRIKDPTPGIWTFRVMAMGGDTNGSFHMWLPITEFLSAPAYFLEPDPYTTLTEPSMAANCLGITAYNDANNSLYVRAGRGYSKNGRIRPDLAAPGVNVSTPFGRETGSSMAAAITAGAAAQFFQWAVVEGNNRVVESRELKNSLIRGADRKSALSYPNRSWGYGTLNLEGTFEVLADV